jgi:D-inositol-3-phosphate glycosyltransferase
VRLLCVADGVVETGFARVAHNVLGEQVKHGWDVHHLAVNYNGGEHSFPWAIYPAARGGDIYGAGLLEILVKSLKPDVVLIISDPWVMPIYFEQMQTKVPVVAYLPVDAPNQWAAAKLGPLSLAIAYTRFGAFELRKGGYTGPLEVIPHGIDLSTFYPGDQGSARRALFPPAVDATDCYIVGNVNRNQPRKRLDLTIQYFAEWWHSISRPEDVRLLLHAAEQDIGWDLRDLATYYGVISQLILTFGKDARAHCSDERLRHVYQSLDVQVSTTLGEGWGLTTMEGMACGVPQIVPDYSALGEWPEGKIYRVKCSGIQAHPQHLNTLGGVVDKTDFIDGLDLHYECKHLCSTWGDIARRAVERDEFTWASVGRRFDAALRSVCGAQG